MGIISANFSFLLVRFNLLNMAMRISVGILFIFCDSVNRASQKQEFRSQRACEPVSQRDRETKTHTKQLASGEIEQFFYKNVIIVILLLSTM